MSAGGTRRHGSRGLWPLWQRMRGSERRRFWRRSLLHRLQPATGRGQGGNAPLFSLSHRLDHAAQCAVAQKDGVEECGAGMDEGEDDEDGFAERMDLAKVPDVEIG